MHFTTYFNIPLNVLEGYGAFDINVYTDIPVFIDPFLIYHSENEEYQLLHNEIIRYLAFLRDKAATGRVCDIEIDKYYSFKEVKQNCLGFCEYGISGRGYGKKKAEVLKDKVAVIFADANDEDDENDARRYHIESIGLAEKGVGKDILSDITTNLIKNYLCVYTEEFAHRYMQENQYRAQPVERAYFNYETELWEPRTYDLPIVEEDYRLLTPRDMLRKGDMIMSREDMVNHVSDIAPYIENVELRTRISQVYISQINSTMPYRERDLIVESLIREVPQFYSYYARYKEDKGDAIRTDSLHRINKCRYKYGEVVRQISEAMGSVSLENVRLNMQTWLTRLKEYMENEGGYNIMYNDERFVFGESDIKKTLECVMYTPGIDTNALKSILSFRLASNPKLKNHLRDYLENYKATNAMQKKYVGIFFNSDEQEINVRRILRDLELTNHDNVTLIDVRKRDV